MIHVANIAENYLNGGVDWALGGCTSLLYLIIYYFSKITSQFFEYNMITSLLTFFQMFGTALFVSAVVFAVLETCISYQSGGGSNFHGLAINILKGFIMTSLFTVLPQRLFRFTCDIELQIVNLISTSGAGTFDNFLKQFVLHLIQTILPPLAGILQLPIMLVFIYVLVKVFFGNLKRAGILLCLIFVGAFHIFNIPRGYNDGFSAWLKQIIGLCFTHFAQNLILVIGMIIVPGNMVLGFGVCLSATEVPRIAQHFGLDTSVKGNVSAVIYTANSAASLVSRFIK